MRVIEHDPERPCRDCALVYRSGSRSGNYCAPANRSLARHEMHGRAPDWCPLRAGPVTVRSTSTPSDADTIEVDRRDLADLIVDTEAKAYEAHAEAVRAESALVSARANAKRVLEHVRALKRALFRDCYTCTLCDEPDARHPACGHDLLSPGEAAAAFIANKTEASS